jgi:hypothetical protein
MANATTTFARVLHSHCRQSRYLHPFLRIDSHSHTAYNLDELPLLCFRVQLASPWKGKGALACALLLILMQGDTMPCSSLKEKSARWQT